ncbi:transcriptional repressor [Nocardioides sp. SOB44]|jgi:Fur family ferric uptake transcriptional regulator|uniref:Transcriptional repressor n=1 Tax=Nocardioides cremeus TaxID=3058044 RepID=A0ABT8TKX2_9ACTN|nr:transcriptional repressor [Nocardioides cremeus]MDO3394615.1 transcriptional repressor [Nocardioides cremeus]
MAERTGTDVRRSTRQRTLVRDLVGELDSLRSAQEIHALLRERGESVGLSTVYRALQALAEDDEVDVVRNEQGEVLYRQCSVKHHHHLVCRSCGRAVELVGPTVERWADQAASEHGFTDVTHTVELFGVCPRCAAAAQ